MRPLRYSINVTLDGCRDHRAIPADEDLYRHAVENLDQVDWNAELVRGDLAKAVHERFHGVDLAVIDPERLPHRQLIAAALAHAPGHAQPHDAHALIHSDDARLHVTEALEDCERLAPPVMSSMR
jgi:hypothetical protein